MPQFTAKVIMLVTLLGFLLPPPPPPSPLDTALKIKYQSITTHTHTPPQ